MKKFRKSFHLIATTMLALTTTAAPLYTSANELDTLSTITPILSEIQLAADKPTPLYTYNFESGTDGWSSRGNAKVTLSNTSHSGIQGLHITGRTANWHGVSKEIRSLLDNDNSYTFGMWVKFNEGNSTEALRLTLQSTNNAGVTSYTTVAANEAITHGEWTYLEGTVVLTSDMIDAMVYVESPNETLNFYVDDIAIYGEKSSTPITPRTYFDFEDGTQGWGARGSEKVSLCTTKSYKGSNSIMSSGRTSSWQGATTDITNLLEEGKSYYFSVWVMYDASSASNSQKMNLSLACTPTGGSETYKNLVSETVNKGTWTLFKTSFTYNGGMDVVKLYVEGGTMDFYLDEISITEFTESNIEEDIPSIKDTYSDYFKMGTAVNSNVFNPSSTALIDKHFNSLTCGNEMKPDALLDYNSTIQYMNETGDQTQPIISLANAKPVLDYAKKNNIPMRGHVLIWHAQTPRWLFAENYSKADNAPLVSREIMLQRMENYIKTVFETLETEYPTVDFYSWDVVNEAILPNTSDGYRPGGTVAGTDTSLWMHVIGKDYIEKAFEYARAYAPSGTLLAYNDYNECETVKSNYIYELCKKLVANGTLDVIGMQQHNSMNSPSVSELETAIRKYASLGVKIEVTELDITTTDTSENGLNQQGAKYKLFLDKLKSLKDEGIDINAVVFWGLTDEDSWRSSQKPLLFDEDYKAKPAYWGVIGDSETIVTQTVKTPEREAEEDWAWDSQKGTDLVASDGTKIATFKTAWDSNNLYIKLIPSDTYQGRTITATLYATPDAHSTSGMSRQTVTFSQDTVAIFSNLGSLSSGDSVGLDAFVRIDTHTASWNSPSTTDAIAPNSMGTLTLTSAPKHATALKGTPIIDGTVDDIWTDATDIDVNTFSVGAQGAVGNAKMLWDENYLYILMDVKDNLLSKAASNTYDQDSVEVFIDEDNAKTPTYELGDVQYRVNFDNERSINGATDTDSFISATQITEEGYILEFALPHRLSPFRSNQLLGLDFQINDDSDGDGSRNNIANWNDLTGMGWTSTEGYGLLRLSSIEATLPENPENPENPKTVTPIVTVRTNGTGSISQEYNISATGEGALDLTKLSIRYYYTKEGLKMQSFYCDNAGINLSIDPWYVNYTDNVQGIFTDSYLEISFTKPFELLANTGSLKLGVRFNQEDWSNYVNFTEVGTEVIYDGQVID